MDVLSGDEVVGRGDGTKLKASLVLYDDWAATVFQWCCRLLAGDRNGAEAALANTFMAFTGSSVIEAPIGQSVQGERSILDAPALARSAYAASLAVAPADQRGVTERAVADLSDRESITQIALLLDVPIEHLLAIDQTIDSAGWATARRAFEHWFDDETRARVRRWVQRGESVAAQSSVGGAFELNGWSVGDHRDVRSSAVNGLGRLSLPVSVPPARRSRRLAVATAVGIATVLVAGAIWVAPSDDSSSDGDPPSEISTAATSDEARMTPTTTKTTPSTPSPDESPDNTIIVTRANGKQVTLDLDNAPRLTLGPGFYVEPAPDDPPVDSIWETEHEPATMFTHWASLQLWTEPGATRTGGRWIALITSAVDPGTPPIGHVTRETLGDHPALIWRQPDGVVWASTAWPSDPANPESPKAYVTSASFGFEPDTIAAVVADLKFIPPQSQATAIDAVLIHAGDLLPGMTPALITGVTCCDATAINHNIDARTVIYAGSAEPSEYIGVVTADAPLDAWQQLIGPTTGYIAIDSSGVETIGDRTVQWASGTFASSETDRQSVAWWNEQGKAVVVSTTGTKDELLALVARVLLAKRSEWQALNEQAYVVPLTRPNTSSQQPPVAQTPDRWLGNLETLDGKWSLSVSKDGTTATVNGGSPNEMHYYWFDLIKPGIVLFRHSIQETVALVRVDQPPEGAAVRFIVPGTEPTVRPITTLDDTEIGFAIDAYTEVGLPTTVELIDADSNVITVLGSTAP